MKINDPKTEQLCFHSIEVMPTIEFKNPGASRNYYGSAMEDLICSVLSLQSIPINGNYEVNFDAKDDKFFYEFKSVKRGGRSVLYDFRMEKEKPYVKTLYYVFGVHNAAGAKSTKDLWGMFKSRGVTLLRIPAAIVHREALKEPLHRIKTERIRNASRRAGYARRGYRDGYRCLPLKNLLKLPHKPKLQTLKKYGLEIPVELITIKESTK